MARSAVEDLRYQHMYHPTPIEQKCPALANVLNKISSGMFGDGSVYEPYVLFLQGPPTAIRTDIVFLIDS
jgi:hypothetical protein